MITFPSLQLAGDRACIILSLVHLIVFIELKCGEDKNEHITPAFKEHTVVEGIRDSVPA